MNIEMWIIIGLIIFTCILIYYSSINKNYSRDRHKKIVGSIFLLIHTMITIFLLPNNLYKAYNFEIILLLVLITGYLFIPSTNKITAFYLVLGPTLFILFQSTEMLTQSLQSPGIKIDESTIKNVKYFFMGAFFLTVIVTDAVASLLVGLNKVKRT